MKYGVVQDYILNLEVVLAVEKSFGREPMF